MQQNGKSTHTSVGAAFFLFLGLAVIPFSLKAVGLEESLSPRLAAATDAWRQVAEAFGGGFQPGVPADLAAVNYPDSEFSNPAAEPSLSAEPGCAHQTACEREIEAPATVALNIRDANSQTAGIAKAACRKSSERACPLASQSPLAMHADAIRAALLATPIEALRSLQVDSAIEKEWVTVLERRMRRGEIRSLSEMKRMQIPHELRVVLQMKSPVASRKAAECKVRTAMASTMGLDLQRTRLTSEPLAGPDNCEL
jgi:hypothetical protein